MSFSLFDFIGATFILFFFGLGIISFIRLIYKFIKKLISENKQKPRSIKYKIVHIDNSVTIKDADNYFPFKIALLNYGDKIFFDLDGKQISLSYQGHEYVISNDTEYIKYILLNEIDNVR